MNDEISKRGDYLAKLGINLYPMSDREKAKLIENLKGRGIRLVFNEEGIYSV